MSADCTMLQGFYQKKFKEKELGSYYNIFWNFGDLEDLFSSSSYPPFVI
jgi:hypothetical protein